MTTQLHTEEKIMLQNTTSIPLPSHPGQQSVLLYCVQACSVCLNQCPASNRLYTAPTPLDPSLLFSQGSSAIVCLPCRAPPAYVSAVLLRGGPDSGERSRVAFLHN